MNIISQRRVSAAICHKRHDTLSLAKFKSWAWHLVRLAPQVEARHLVYTPLHYYSLRQAQLIPPELYSNKYLSQTLLFCYGEPKGMYKT